MVNKVQNLNTPFMGRTTSRGMLGVSASHPAVRSLRNLVTGSPRGDIVKHLTAKRKKTIGIGGRRGRRAKRRRHKKRSRCRKHHRRHKCRTRHRRRRRRRRTRRRR